MDSSSACSCPSCGTPLYSERARMCGKCGAVISRELIKTDEQAEAIVKSRQWARDLANVFDTTGRNAEEERLAATPTSELSVSELTERLQRLSCVSEFEHRKRPTWLYLLGAGSTLLLPTFVIFVICGRLLPITRNLVFTWMIF